jgi:uncharacterized protein (TIGR02145 family)
MKAFKITILIICAIFTAPVLFAQQEIKTIQITENGQIVVEKNLQEIDSIVFKTYTPSTDINGVEINGVVWATRNVDMPGTFTENITDYGMLYQWNRPIGWSSTDPMTNFEGGSTWDSSIPEGDTWETSNDTWEESNNVCPTGWRIPTAAELQNLMASGSVWTTVNGVNGRIYGSGETVVFFPAVGNRNNNDGSLGTQNYYGFYWSATAAGVSRAVNLYFSSSSSSIGNYYRGIGESVRCVAE